MNGVTAGEIGAFARAANGDLFIGGEVAGGVFRSQDNGTTWTQSGLAAPPFNGNLTALAVNRLGEPLAARNDAGGNPLHRYTNGSWSPSGTGIPTYSNVRSIALNPRSGVLYAGNSYSTNLGGVYTSADDGHTWQSFSTGLPNTGVNVLAFGIDGTLYMVTRDGRFYRTSGPVP
jgi:photosystem II stability/assembly factor-like uncharacterized protein